MIVQTHKLNMIPMHNLNPVVVRVSQFDHDSRLLRFDIYSGEEKYEVSFDATVSMNGVKPSGETFSIGGTHDGLVAEFQVYQNMTDEAGVIPCELVFELEGRRIGSANFILAVEESPIQQHEAKVLTIEENGTFNVKPYDEALVNVPQHTPSGTFEITENGEYEVGDFQTVIVNVQ